MTLTTNGKNSPLFKTKVNDEGGGLFIQKTTGLLMKSKIANIEGATTVSITKECKTRCGENPTKDNNNFDQGGIMLYQSGSRLIWGNAFSCEDSIFEILNMIRYYDNTATMFFVTNIGANIYLKNWQLKYGSNIFINLKANEEWGEKGANGGDANIYI